MASGEKTKQDYTVVQFIMKNSIFTKLFGGLGLVVTFLGTTAKAGQEGAVYTMDNAAAANHVLVYHREESGQINGGTSVATGGAGSGAGLSSQGSVLLSHD